MNTEKEVMVESESVIILREYTLRYLGEKKHHTATYSQMIQGEKKVSPRRETERWNDATNVAKC